jgi:hypothetical protein
MELEYMSFAFPLKGDTEKAPENLPISETKL